MTGNHSWTTFSQIDPQNVVDTLCAEFRTVDALLCSPKHGLPRSLQKYIDKTQEPQVFHMKRYFRNVAALDKYEALIDRLDPLFIGIEYFNNKVELKRTTGTPLAKAYVDNFFCSTMMDSLRSSLDIFAKFVGWFFDLRGKETMGFSYRGLLAPLKQHSQRIADECNGIYRSPNFNRLKSFRDSEKHEGQGKTLFRIDETDGTFRLELRTPETMRISNIEPTICACLGSLMTLLETTSQELTKWPMGYDSPADKIATIDEDGYFRMPGPNSKSRQQKPTK